MPFKFGSKSEGNLKTPENGKYVHPALVALCREVLARSTIDFMIIDGMRTIEEQRINVRKGFSKTMKSKHLEGRAIDFAPILPGQPGVPDWVAIDKFKKIGALFQKVASEWKLKVTWGGTWRWKDWGHVQLDAIPTTWPGKK